MSGCDITYEGSTLVPRGNSQDPHQGLATDQLLALNSNFIALKGFDCPGRLRQSPVSVRQTV